MGRANFHCRNRQEQCTEKPIAIAIIGPNGSGKSSAISELISDFEFLSDGMMDPPLKKRINRAIRYASVNPDEIAARMTTEHSDWPQYEIDQAAQAEADRIRRTLAKNRIDFAFETVGSHQSKVHFLNELSSSGYYVVVLYIGTEDSAINKRRVRERVLRGGHSVAEEKISPRWERTMLFLPQYISAADFAVVFDNSREAAHYGDSSARLLLVKEAGAINPTDDYHDVEWIQRFLPIL